MRFSLDPQLHPATENGWRRRWFDIIFRHDTPPARNFDLILIVAIVASVAVVIADSEPGLHARYAVWLRGLEWFFTGLFTLEYVARLAVVRRPARYAASTWGIIDLLSILPTYLSVLLPGSQSLAVLRVLRVLRLFRILKLTQYVLESGVLLGALARSRRKILVFIAAVLTLVIVFGALMYLVEGPEHGFHSIPTGMYWAIVTMATVGFGDIAPQTGLGRVIASVLILIGYGMIAVPTGIYSAELVSGMRQPPVPAVPADVRACAACGLVGHGPDARFCRHCGGGLGPPA